MPKTVPARHAAMVWLVTVGLDLAACLLAVFNRLDLSRFFGEFMAGPIINAVAFVTVGALVVSRQPSNSIGWLLCVVGALDAFTAFATQYARYGLLTNPGALPSVSTVAWLNLWIWIPQLMLGTTYVLLLFPDGQLPSRGWRPVAWLLGGLIALLTLTAAITPHADASLPEVTNPFAVPGSERILGIFEALGLPIQALGVLVAVASLVVRFRRAKGDERQAIKWLAYAGAVVAVTLAVPAVLVVAGLIDSTATSLVGGILEAGTLPCLVAAIGVGILRYRLWQIDVLINRTLVYGGLTASVVGVYVLVVGYFGAIFQVRNDLVSLFAAAVVAVLFQPLRERLQRGVNRLLYGQRDEPYAVLAGLSRRLEATIAPDIVLPTIVETIRDALKLPYAEIRLSDDSGLGASSGSATGPCLHLPLVYQHENVGELMLAARAPGEVFNLADRRLLDDLARQVGVAAHAVQLTADLQRSRERLVSTREEERRRLRRDLHDGLGPVLAGLTLQLDAARGLVQHDPVAADALLLELKVRTQATVSDVRRLVYALRPPALDDLGLGPALRAAAAQYDGNPSCTRITLEIQDNLPTLPAAAEVAAYRIAQEALANAIHHADAAACVLRLRLNAAADMLCLEVIDNGQGLPPSLISGVGLHSMRERAAELGGSCTIDSIPSGGTRVCAQLPCTIPSVS